MMASLDQNKETARLFVRQVCGGKVDPALMTDDFVHWTAITGELDCDELNAVMRRVVSLFTSPFVIEVDSIIAEGNRVALEAHSEADLRSGELYRNRYHILFEFAADGRIRRMNEHMDSQHVLDVIHPLFEETA
jgi:ketosteroid isomerase-like protein